MKPSIASLLLVAEFMRGQVAPDLEPPPSGVRPTKMPRRFRRGKGRKDPAWQARLAELRSMPIRPSDEDVDAGIFDLTNYRREMNQRKRARRERREAA